MGPSLSEDAQLMATGAAAAAVTLQKPSFRNKFTESALAWGAKIDDLKESCTGPPVQATACRQLADMMDKAEGHFSLLAASAEVAAKRARGFAARNVGKTFFG